jgi:hypothetical protein
MSKFIALFLAVACLSCAKEPKAIAVDPNSNIGKIDQNGITVIVDKPSDPACSRTYVSVELDTFQNCLITGLTYVQVANILGYKGTLGAVNGNTEVWQWNGREGTMIATFIDGRLVSKSQSGLVSSN